MTSLDLSIAAGERVLLLGASGAGKSTLLRALAGVIGHDEGEQTGELLVGGMPPTALRGTSGLVLQDTDSQVILSRIGDDVAFGCENLGVPRDEIWRRVRLSLDDVGLLLPLDHPTARLSGGQRQRLALAGVLAMNPGVLLLDEPTANLDPEGVREVVDAVDAVTRACGATLVVVEHRVAVWRHVVDRVIVLGSSGVIADGSPDEVLERQGAALAAQGIWVPGHPPAEPVRRRREAAPTVLSASDLTIGRGSDAIRRGVDVSVRGGRVLALTGRNGAGKSTLGLTLAGLLPALGGELTASDDLAAGAGPLPHRWKSRQLLTRIGTVFQNPEHQFLAPTVRAELEVGPRALGHADADIARRVDELLERLRLTALAKANPFTLSGGEQRRLSVATALATAPRMLVLDEPTFGQDSLTWAQLVALIAELADEGTAIVAATHDDEFLRVLADDTVHLA